MYETLSYLREVLLNPTYETYIKLHIFKPLNMAVSTFSVVEAEARGTLADGFLPDAQDFTKREQNTEGDCVLFKRPGKERMWAGAGGVLTSARNLVGFSRFH